MNLKPRTIGYLVKASVAGKHINEEFKTLDAALLAIRAIHTDGETFVGQITIIPIAYYEMVIRQR